MALTTEEQTLKTLWLSSIGTDEAKLPPDHQWGMWLRAFGPHAATAIIRTSRKQHGMLKYESRVMSPRDLWRFCNATAKYIAADAGFVRTDTAEELVPRHSSRYTSVPLPMGNTSKRRPADTFVVPDGWRDADDLAERYVPAEWEKA